MSETVANPANSRLQAAITEPRMDTPSANTIGEEEMLSAPINALDIPLDSGAVIGWVGRLADFQREVTDAERIDQIRALERLKSAAAAAQARITVDLDTSVRAAHAAAGIPAERQGRGLAGQIALARQESPYRGSRHLGLGKMLVGEMPHTLAALAQGLISEWRATLLVRETACLTREHRRLLDTHFCADPTQMEGWGDKRLTSEIQKLAYQLDRVAVTKRRAKAESERRVTCRPAPDAMARLTILGPPQDGPRHTLDITTPTGHTYRSTAPAPPSGPRPVRPGAPGSPSAGPRPPAAGGRARRGSRAWSGPIRPTVE